jgi:hypothetical protein
MHPFLRPRSALIAFGVLASLATTGASSPAADTGTTPCRGTVDRGVLPVWARDGFSEKRPRMAHVVGDSGRIAALVFGEPLQSPPGKARNNKILWVSRKDTVSMSDLRIRAQRMRGIELIGNPVARKVAGGPGPSIIDLPGSGCWRLTLTWSGRTDTLDLRYGPTDHS